MASKLSAMWKLGVKVQSDLRKAKRALHLAEIIIARLPPHEEHDEFRRLLDEFRTSTSEVKK